MQQILEAFDGHELFFATYYSVREAEVRSLAPAYFTKNIGYNLWRMIKAFPWAFQILRKENPDLVFSMGAEIAVPFIYLAKLMGKKTMYIESWCRVENLSLAGKLVAPVVDEMWVQWPQLAEGKRTRFEGAIL